jgi:hypothetical protein
MRTLTRAALCAAFLSALAVACGSDGLTTIELPIATLEIQNAGACNGVVPQARCQFVVEARTAEGQLITNPILRWFSSNSAVASVSDEGLVEALSSGQATITVTNSTGTASDSANVLVLITNPK